ALGSPESQRQDDAAVGTGGDREPVAERAGPARGAARWGTAGRGRSHRVGDARRVLNPVVVGDDRRDSREDVLQCDRELALNAAAFAFTVWSMRSVRMEASPTSGAHGAMHPARAAPACCGPLKLLRIKSPAAAMSSTSGTPSASRSPGGETRGGLERTNPKLCPLPIGTPLLA